ncbi:MAG TPA: DUF72 domain-containing protein [Candidatus Limnocylindrales bacterium]|nr:DUF72 domain-containing protein [Candidatus Limnocylindrales bacterium]
MPILLGTSGWQYRHWRETFYPRGVPQGQWLEYYAERFATVESNAAFYRLPEGDTFAAWAERTPADFVMAVKVSRYLTHIKRLGEPAEAVERFVERAGRLGRKLGPALIQLPPSMKADINRLAETLQLFPAGWRVAVEFRHPSWYIDEVRTLLEQHGAALCLADRLGAVSPIWRTTDWTYLRFHAGRAHPSPCYGRRALGTWVTRLAEHWRPSEDLFVYFNNDPRACALRDARWFARAAERGGLPVTRAPRASDVRLGD